MLNSGKKIALCTTKKINILTLVCCPKKPTITPPPPPPLQVKWSVPNIGL